MTNQSEPEDTKKKKFTASKYASPNDNTQLFPVNSRNIIDVTKHDIQINVVDTQSIQTFVAMVLQKILKDQI
jgi:hypothetical protein